MIDVYEADPEWLNDVDGMMAGVVKVIKDAGLHIMCGTFILNLLWHPSEPPLTLALDHFFSFSAGFQLAPQGISITITIEESHLTIHTWPEHKAALVDIFTCGSSPLLPVLPILVRTARFLTFFHNLFQGRPTNVPTGKRTAHDNGPREVVAAQKRRCVSDRPPRARVEESMAAQGTPAP